MYILLICLFNAMISKKHDEGQMSQSIYDLWPCVRQPDALARPLGVTVKFLARWILPRNAGSIDFPKLASPMIADCQLHAAGCSLWEPAGG